MSFINKLSNNEISTEDCYQIGFQLGESALALPNMEKTEDFYTNFLSRYNDTEVWVKEAEKYFDENETSTYLTQFREYIERHKEEWKGNTDSLGIAMDIHPPNALYTDGKFLPIDTYQPKESWFLGPKHFNLYRIATDMYVFIGKDAFDETVRGYKEAVNDNSTEDHQNIQILYQLLIEVPYHYLLSQNDPAKSGIAQKYLNFLRKQYGI